MKRFFLLLAMTLFLPAMALQVPIGWETNLATARAKAAKMNKPLLIVISDPDWNNSCKSFHKNIVDDYFFNTTARKYAVCLFLYQPKNDLSGLNHSQKSIDALKKILPGKGVPRYAIVNSKLELLAKPQKRTVSGFINAISAASVKTNGTPVRELSKLAEYENRKTTLRPPKQKTTQSSSCSGCRTITIKTLQQGRYAPPCIK